MTVDKKLLAKLRRPLSKTFFYSFTVFFALLCATTVVAWSGPTASPPSNNTGAPIDVTGSNQVKSGSITAAGLAAPTICLGSSCITSWAGAGGGQWTTSGTNIYNANSGNVGVGTSNPAAKLDVANGTIRAEDSNTQYAPSSGAGLEMLSLSGLGYLLEYNRSTSSYMPLNIDASQITTNAPLTVSGTLTVNTSSTYGIITYSSGSVAVYGHSVSSYGVYGQSDNSWGGVFVAPAADGVVVETPNGAIYSELMSQGYGLLTNQPVLASAFYYNSDERLKKNIVTIASSTALEDIMGLRPVTYNWINPATGTGTQLGFIAQEVQKVVPELVATDASTTMEAVDYAKVTPLLVGAAQEQEAKIDAQQTQIDAQQKEIDTLTAEVEALTAEK